MNSSDSRHFRKPEVVGSSPTCGSVVPADSGSIGVSQNQSSPDRVPTELASCSGELTRKLVLIGCVFAHLTRPNQSDANVSKGRAPKRETRAPKSPHDRAAAEWAASFDGQTSGFARAVKEWLKAQAAEVDADGLEGMDAQAALEMLSGRHGFGFIPDAWAWDEAGADDWALTSIIACEIQHSSPITEEKLENYCWLWWAAEYGYLQVRLMVVDRCENLREVDLMAHAYASLDPDAKLLPLRWVDERQPPDPNDRIAHAQQFLGHAAVAEVSS